MELDHSQCLNPDCLEVNQLGAKICRKCGSRLLLGDRYRPISVLGKGGMGRTFLAVDEHRLNTLCVIKQFLPLSQSSTELEKLIQLFKQEAICLRDLGKHPNIPDLEAFFAQEGRFYLIQEFIDGQDLFQELRQRGRYNEQEVRQVFNEILPILHFLHERNVIHRDIKPSNIVRRQDGSLVLIDFGVSKQLSASVQTSVGTVTGTVGYAPPEQMRGVVFPCSDLYALAVTSLRLLTICLPRPDGSDDLYDPMEGNWKWKDKVAVSDNLAYVLDRLLQNTVKHRYQTAAEVWQALNYRPNPVPTPEPQIIPTPKLNIAELSHPQPESNTSTSSTPRRSRISYNHSNQNIVLLSDVGIDYNQLKTLLTARKYKEADEETYRLILSVCHRQQEGWLRNEDLMTFPCTDLNTIDQLWIEHSRRRFGFSIQKRIYQNLERQINHPKKLWLSFCEQVGWRAENKWLSYSEIVFGVNAPTGHLPCGSPPKDLTQGMIQFELGGNFVVASIIAGLVRRLEHCQK
ncbi:serine/threonine protein kinase [Gloeocapsa sp. PCC 73106]|nr:serine/threonine protein kinase [Gloeocapsa sp. PCC 73106]